MLHITPARRRPRTNRSRRRVHMGRMQHDRVRFASASFSGSGPTPCRTPRRGSSARSCVRSAACCTHDVERRADLHGCRGRAHAEPLSLGRQQRFRTITRTSGTPNVGQRADLLARDAASAHVADDPTVRLLKSRLLCRIVYMRGGPASGAHGDVPALTRGCDRARWRAVLRELDRRPARSVEHDEQSACIALSCRGVRAALRLSRAS